MNREFEAIVMNTYAELCIMWRVAHVTNQNQAEDFDAKLKSLEAVVAAFNLNSPADEPAPAPPAQQAPAQSTPQRSQIPPASTSIPTGGGMMLED